ncbi:hypothetical protein CBL_12330 [Carabus blaptoides fortunei]
MNINVCNLGTFSSNRLVQTQVQQASCTYRLASPPPAACYLVRWSAGHWSSLLGMSARFGCPRANAFTKRGAERLAAQTDSKRPGGPRLGVASQAWLQDRMTPTKSTTAPSMNRDSISSEKAQVSDKSPNSCEKDNTVKPNMCVNADKDSPENETADQVLKECENLKRFVPSGSDSIRVDTRKKARESIVRISMGACEFRGIVKSLRSELRAKERENFELLLRIAKLETSANESNKPRMIFKDVDNDVEEAEFKDCVYKQNATVNSQFKEVTDMDNNIKVRGYVKKRGERKDIIAEVSPVLRKTIIDRQVRIGWQSIRVADHVSVLNASDAMRSGTRQQRARRKVCVESAMKRDTYSKTVRVK